MMTFRVVRGAIVDSILISVPFFRFFPIDLIADSSAVRSGFLVVGSSGVSTAVIMKSAFLHSE